MATKAHPPSRFWQKVLGVSNVVLPYGGAGDRMYRNLRFWINHGRAPTGAMRYNDVMHRLAQNGSHLGDLVTRTTCKEQGKVFWADFVEDERIVPTLAVLRTASDVADYDFPETCIIKGTAGSGQVIKRQNASPVDRAEIAGWLKHSHYRHTREANYKRLKNAVIVEPLLGDGRPLADFSFVCWRGRIGVVFYNIEVNGVRGRRIYTSDWSVLPVSKYLPLLVDAPPLPKDLETITTAAQKVAAHFEFVRVDFLVQGDAWWAGEITHCDGGAASSFIPLDGECLVNEAIFGEEAFSGPYETHGALSAKGPPATAG